MQVPLLDLKSQYAEMKSEILPALEKICDSQYFILGADVEKFEKEKQDYLGREDELENTVTNHCEDFLEKISFIKNYLNHLNKMKINNFITYFSFVKK